MYDTSYISILLYFQADEENIVNWIPTGPATTTVITGPMAFEGNGIVVWYQITDVMDIGQNHSVKLYQSSRMSKSMARKRTAGSGLWVDLYTEFSASLLRIWCESTLNLERVQVEKNGEMVISRDCIELPNGGGS